MMGVISFDRGR